VVYAAEGNLGELLAWGEAGGRRRQGRVGAITAVDDQLGVAPRRRRDKRLQRSVLR
jgi:hypothetical protein